MNCVPAGLKRVVLAAVLVASNASAYELKRDSSGEPVRWQRAVEFVVAEQVARSLGDDEAAAAIDAAFETFTSAVPGLELAHRYDERTSARARYELKEGANQNEIIAPAHWEHDEDFLAVTIVTLDRVSHRILDADIELNTHGPRFHSNRGQVHDESAYDLQAVLTHELGHALGLAHNAEDEQAVMYPYLVEGDTTKRMLTSDDLSGLAALYDEVAAYALTQAAGCAAVAGEGTGWVALLGLPLVWLARRRRSSDARAGSRRFARPFAVGALLLPVVAAASSPRAAARVLEADVVATGRVSSTRYLPPDEDGRLFTEVVVQLRECIKGECPEALVTLVRGGVYGDIEQHVEGQSIPKPGDSLGVTLSVAARGAEKASQTASRSAAIARPRAAVYRLDRARDFLAFAEGLRQAGLRVNLRAPTGPRVPQTPAGRR